MEELVAAKYQRSALIKSAFDGAIAMGNTYDLHGLNWRLAGEAVIRDYDLGTRYLKVRNQPGMFIKDADNQKAYSTLAEIEWIANEHAAWGVEQWIKLNQKLAQIESAQTTEEVNSINW